MICPAEGLRAYLHRTDSLRPSNVFCLFITCKQPFMRATSQSLSRWIKTTLLNSGLDTTRFSAHSTRHATSTAAARRKVSLDIIRATAGGLGNLKRLLRSNRPVSDRDSFARAILDQ